MKKFTLVLIITASILVAAGIMMVVVSGILSGGGNLFNMDFSKLSGNNSTITVKTIEASPATLKEIDISMINVSIETSQSGDKVVISYPENSRNTYEIVNTASKISIKEHSKPFEWFSFNFTIPDKEQSTVLITVPDSLDLDTLDLHTTNGKILLDTMQASSADLSSTNGSVILKSSVIDTMVASSTNGGLEMTGSFIKDLNFTTTNGSITIKDGDIAKVRLYTTNGGLDATGLPGKATDYSLKCNTVNGSVIVNGLKVSTRGSYTSLTTGERSIEVTTTNGSIKLETLIK